MATIDHTRGVNARTPGSPLLRVGEWPRTAKVGLAMLGVVVMSVVFAPLLSLETPLQQSLTTRLQQPSLEHWLGTDYLGRDVFSRLLYGGRFILLIAALSVAIEAILGTLLGALSGLVGGLLDEVTMRVVDFAIAIPQLLAALIIVAMMGTSLPVLILAITIRSWAPFARLARALTLELKESEYVQSSKSIGCSRWFIVSRHIAPNILGPVMALTCLGFGLALITVGALSYLGLGVQPPTPDWGAMLAEGQPYMQRVPLLVIAPGFMIFIAALGFTLLGQGLAGVVDPKRRGRRSTQAAA